LSAVLWFYRYGDHRPLRSFPTRRSSDLTHFLLAAATLTPPDLRQAGTRTEFARRIADATRGLRPGEWMQGGNWDAELWGGELPTDRKSTRLNSSHVKISYAVFCLKKKKN